MNGLGIQGCLTERGREGEREGKEFDLDVPDDYIMIVKASYSLTPHEALAGPHMLYVVCFGSLPRNLFSQ